MHSAADCFIPLMHFSAKGSNALRGQVIADPHSPAIRIILEIQPQNATTHASTRSQPAVPRTGVPRELSIAVKPGQRGAGMNRRRKAILPAKLLLKKADDLHGLSVAELQRAAEQYDRIDVLTERRREIQRRLWELMGDTGSLHSE